MTRPQGRQLHTARAWPIALAGATLLTATVFVVRQSPLAAQPAARFEGPTSSQPLALSASGEFLVAANPDNNSVSFFDLRADRNRRVATVPVQNEPNGVAFLPNGLRAYVANTVSGTVSVINLNIANGVVQAVQAHSGRHRTLRRSSLTPNGDEAVRGQRPLEHRVRHRHRHARRSSRPSSTRASSRAASPSPTTATTTTPTRQLYVTQFLSCRSPARSTALTTRSRGWSRVISTATNTVVGRVVRQSDCRHRIQGDRRCARPDSARTELHLPHRRVSEPAEQRRDSRQLRLPAEHRRVAERPGPLRRQHAEPAGGDQTDHRSGRQRHDQHAQGGGGSDRPPKLFITVPWAMAFKHHADEGYVVSAASNIVVKVDRRSGDRRADRRSDPDDPTRVLQIPVGKNPRGIVINASDTRAYVMNYVSRDVSVIDLTPAPRSTCWRRSRRRPCRHRARSPTRSTSARSSTTHRSACSIRRRRTARRSPGGCRTTGGAPAPPAIRSGSRQRRLDLPGRPEAHDSAAHRLRSRRIRHASRCALLNWSANRDEEEDFELNIRGVSGGQGLIVLADGVTPDADVNNFPPLANADRNQLKVRGVAPGTRSRRYVQFGIRAPISPVSKTDPDVIAGRALFTAANCQQCHGGTQWTSSRVRFTPPPSAARSSTGRSSVSCDRSARSIRRCSMRCAKTPAPPLGADGFVPPSLLSVFAFARSSTTAPPRRSTRC